MEVYANRITQRLTETADLLDYNDSRRKKNKEKFYFILWKLPRLNLTAYAVTRSSWWACPGSRTTVSTCGTGRTSAYSTTCLSTSPTLPQTRSQYCWGRIQGGGRGTVSTCGPESTNT